jgi:NAD(P)-dependent dehydrogenase (short-subunit alcohol dehydrogenase family)
MLGATVVIVARDAARSAAAGAEITGRVPLTQVEFMSADLSSLANTRHAARHVQINLLGSAADLPLGRPCMRQIGRLGDFQRHCYSALPA